MDSFLEIVEELTLYLYRKHYDEPKKDMARIRIMYLLSQCCKDEETFKESVDILIRKREEKK